MTNCTNHATQDGATMASKPAAQIFAARMSARVPAHMSARISVRALLPAVQHTLTILSISTVALVAFLLARPDLAKHLSLSFSDEEAAAAEVVTASPPTALMADPAAAAIVKTAPAQLTPAEKSALNSRKEQEWVTSWLSKRYHVAGDAANMLVATAYLTAHEIKLDPLLILAVMAIESGLNPFAESPVGAQGLMQVMSKIHHEKFRGIGGVQAALNPAANIRVGSLILKEYVTRGGSIEAGLKTYVGAAAFDSDGGYGSRVLAEYRRLKQVAIGKQVPAITPVMATTAPHMTPSNIKIDKNEEIASL